MDMSYVVRTEFRIDCQIGILLGSPEGLQLNCACTSAPRLPTWHAQRQVESRMCSAGLTLKDFERSNEFK